jgi:hypothetical protein
MKMLSYDMLARDFSKTWASIETKGEEVVVTRITPEPASSTALAVFGDLHGVLGERAGAVLAGKLAAARDAKRRPGTLRELRNPWAS